MELSNRLATAQITLGGGEAANAGESGNQRGGQRGGKGGRGGREGAEVHGAATLADVDDDDRGLASSSSLSP